MQKVITVIFSNSQVIHSSEQDPGASYENKELNAYLDQGYKVKETITQPMGGSAQYISITFILEKAGKPAVG